MILVLMPLGLTWSSNVGAFEEPCLVEVCPKRAAGESAYTPSRMARPCSRTPARWASKASSQNGRHRRTAPGARPTGSRARTRFVRRCVERKRKIGGADQVVHAIGKARRALFRGEATSELLHQVIWPRRSGSR